MEYFELMAGSLQYRAGKSSHTLKTILLYFHGTSGSDNWCLDAIGTQW